MQRPVRSRTEAVPAGRGNGAPDDERRGVVVPASPARGAAAGEQGGEAAALVRLPVQDGEWAESLPPAPGSYRVTASLSSAALADEHGEALTLLGYVLVDGPAILDRAAGDVAWLVVSEALALGHPRWWASVRSLSDAVYRLDLGPVRRRFTAVLEPHGH